MKDAQIGWIAAIIIGGDGAHDEYRARCHRGGRSARRRIGRGDPEADAAAARLSLPQIKSARIDDAVHQGRAALRYSHWMFSFSPLQLPTPNPHAAGRLV